MRKVTSLDATARELLRGRASVTIMTAMSPQEPRSAIRALLSEIRRTRTPTTLLTSCIDGRMDFLCEEDRLAIREGLIRPVVIAGGAPRELSPFCDSLQYPLWSIDRMLASGAIHCDIYVVRASEVLGEIDPGAAVAFTQTMLGRRSVETLVELDPSGPSGLSDAPLDWTGCLAWRDDAAEAGRSAPLEGGTRPPRTNPGADAAHRIARLVSSLVPGNAAVQLGIGTLADEIAGALKPDARMGLHGGSIPDGALDRIRLGDFSRETDGADRGLQIATGLAAAPAFNSSLPGTIALRPISYTHAPDVLAKVAAFWAVNSAIDIDLFGQLNSEWLGGRRVGSAGGLADFTRAAQRSPGGGSIVALPARTSSGIPRIRAALNAPGFVAAPGAEIDYLVTEHGIAKLRGLTRSQRAGAIIGVAHPDDRPGLEAAAESI